MVRRSSTYSSLVRRAAVIAGLTVALTYGQSPESGSNNGLVGTWMVQVTLRNCSTGAALGPAIHSLVTFHRGGTITESPGTTTFAPGQRTVGHGSWTSQGRTFRQEMIAIIVFDTPPNPPASPGFFAGWQTISQRVELTGPDTLTSAGTNEFVRFDGTSYRTGCSTAVARRFR
jgi:hypothetical protein